MFMFNKFTVCERLTLSGHLTNAIIFPVKLN
uniref:Uncharacterized protein n=1 Tax=Anguilla anguilla TaxID=7936 RepID=A0A0E9XK73_ANGAN